MILINIFTKTLDFSKYLYYNKEKIYIREVFYEILY